ncbi:DUF4257 domain-containing protein [Bacillus sp. T33-2]|uniref:DUF4257 domain-containing protein n=1 Tax=Bacillus sp. T33-2 TaxID=2054168 RepID=UPI000C78CC53|nr:DUF4257 domain-containing protein [Bacillus sp. T33-2]PLR94814.1 hypothetical protein CVD19_16205 [Bacillus sp. T33-2]
MLENIIFAIIIGGFVGMAGHVKKRGKIIRPRKTKKFIYLGFLEDVLMSILAAVLLVISSGADTFLRVLLLSIIAGFGGEAILKVLELFQTDKNTTGTENKTNTSA